MLGGDGIFDVNYCRFLDCWQVDIAKSWCQNDMGKSSPMSFSSLRLRSWVLDMLMW